ncbi:hypothetical protein, variant 1 [Plasmodium yoelii 17X]|uniref:CCR4 domain-containing protein 2 n=3 Tax=Plasmodium yoelii TaxID=5861 RepID=A0AAE9WRU2_PLAYO|nr:CCR4 domain-containing protein 2, putative [Plasmodium yoelii]ETB61062.1 hypothetical protein, variant 1 [Plasmodium yoelii 17X]WBY58837.1 CCR4 domain-containing protein 2 [Plasmodium yoelii yoelii]CDU19096.1 conserved Plasmodium protein, unknown function [Plasmodium yoelii]VTZ79681.1 CCR4 domain-containing protein 2, putative [Plasmodium yoelii]|eukprot:XP_022812478.1 CCR4 domain-containing protein 2, putative [Plasmodium yoelii]
MFYGTNSITGFFLKKIRTVKRAKNNEKKYICCSYIRNDISIEKDNICRNFQNIKTQACISLKYNRMDANVEKKIISNYNVNIEEKKNSDNSSEYIYDDNKNNECVIARDKEKQKNVSDNIEKEDTVLNSKIPKKDTINKNHEHILESEYNDMINEQNNNINNLSLGKCISTQKKYIYKFEKFSVFSFNILANSLVDYKYNNNCASVMKWMNRKKLIYKNITNKLSDIICLQEIEKLYFIELQEKLKLLNYKGIFLKKNKETCKDGICIFYNTKVFELLFVDKVIYDKSIFFKKWHAGLIVALRNLKSKKIEYYDSNKNGCNEQINDNLKKNNNNFVNDAHDIIIVSNTHLIFDSRHGDIKLYQLCYLTYRLVFMINKCIKYIKESVKQEKGDKGLIDSSEENTEEHEKDELNDILKPAIIFCGDFNLTPNSLLYYYITNRYINLKNVNLKNISGQYLMFKKQLYIYNSLNGVKIKNIFDENILNDLKYEKYNNLIENMKKESLFSFYKDENILNSEYLINSFSKKKNNLKNFDSFEYTFKKLKNKSSEETYEDVNSEKADSKINESICVSKQEDSVSKFNEIFDSVDTDEKEKNKPINYKTYKYNEKTIKENEKPNVEMHENTKMMDNDDQNFILYYPLYLESIYNGCAQNNVEEKCYKYDDIENLNNSSTHLMIRNVPFTVFHGKQKGCVDYIFYSYKNLKKLSYTNLPSFEQLEKYGCLPNKKYASSDHLYLHATLIRKIED